MNFEIDNNNDIALNNDLLMHKALNTTKRIVDDSMHKSFDDCFAVLFSSRFQFTSPYDNKYFINAANDLFSLMKHYTYQISEEIGQLGGEDFEYTPNFVNILGCLIDTMMAFKNKNVLKGQVDFSWLDASKVTNLKEISSLLGDIENAGMPSSNIKVIVNIFNLAGISKDNLANIIINSVGDDEKLLKKIYDNYENE